MIYPTWEEFKEILFSRPLESIVQEHVLEGLPFVFQSEPGSMVSLRNHLGERLAVSSTSVTVIGSARIGFSLSPDNFSRQFSDESDIDVLIVDERLFDNVWKTLLKWHYPRRISGLDGVDKQWAANRRKDLYWGWFVPDKIRFEGLSLPDVLRPLRDLSTSWFDAFKSLSHYPQFIRRNVSGRLYRTWDHALLYHMDGLRQVKNLLS